MRRRSRRIAGMPRQRSALTKAYGFLVDHNAQLGDEGLRRNALNKVEETRELLAAWVSHARRKRLSKAKREAHLAGNVNLSEAFERLVETGLRLNEIRSEAELTEFLVDEVTELSGAERVLLVLEGEGGPQVAGSLLPPGESDAALVEYVGPGSRKRAAPAAPRCATCRGGRAHRPEELARRAALRAARAAGLHLRRHRRSSTAVSTMATCSSSACWRPRRR